MIQYHSLLTADDERALAVRVRTGDVAARNELVLHNQGLVCSIAKHFVGRGLDLDDLISEGNAGLMRAAEDFDGKRGVRFSTYASHWVKESIRRGIENRGTTWPCRIPSFAHRLVMRWRKTEAAMTSPSGQTPDPDEIAATLGLTPGRRECVEAALSVAWTIHEYDLPDDATLANLAVARPEDPGRDMDDRVERERLDAALARLGERARLVLTLRFGLDGQGRRTLHDAGKVLGITRERTRQIERQALVAMREAMT